MPNDSMVHDVELAERAWPMGKPWDQAEVRRWNDAWGAKYRPALKARDAAKAQRRKMLVDAVNAACLHITDERAKLIREATGVLA